MLLLMQRGAEQSALMHKEGPKSLRKGKMMTQFKGFATREEAIAYRKEHGGYLCYDRRSKKTGRPIGVGIDYAFAVNLGGLDSDKYPYCLQWNNR